MKRKNTRTRLLETAVQHFARDGYYGARVDAIVNDARVNKRMVYHYFGDKKKLYQAALLEVYGRLTNLELKMVSKRQTPEEFLKNVIQTYFHFIQKNPEFVRLLLWENLNQGRSMGHVEVNLTRDPILHRLQEAIRTGISEGSLRPDIQIKHLFISLIGLCMIYFSNQYTLSKTLKMNLRSQRVLHEGIQQTIKLVLRGVYKSKT